MDNPTQEQLDERGGSDFRFGVFLDETAETELKCGCEELDTTFAYFDHSEIEDEHGLVLTSMEFILNRQAFFRDGKDFSDCIPVVIRHEISELWYRLKAEEKSAADGYPHKKAIIEEMLFAYRHGLQDMYLDLAMLWAEEITDRREDFIAEHINAYEKIGKLFYALRTVTPTEELDEEYVLSQAV